jgi:hypothetical protein
MEQALNLCEGSLSDYKELIRGDIDLFILKLASYLKANNSGSERPNNLRSGNVKP